MVTFEEAQYNLKKNLEKKLKDILECPLFRVARETDIRIVELTLYGLDGNNCVECDGKDRSCDMYRDWLYKRGAK